MLKIHFYIRFSTQFGQSLLLSSDISEAPVQMLYLNENFWVFHLELNTATKLPGIIKYKYLLKEKDGEISEEWNDHKQVDVKNIAAEEIHLIDTWNFSGQAENSYYSSPFQNVLLAPQKPLIKVQAYKGYTHLFKVKMPLLQPNEVPCLLGGSKSLGDWDVENPVMMSKEGEWWTVKLNLQKENFPIAYKYALYHKKNKEFVCYEDGDNRLLQSVPVKKAYTVLHDGFMHFKNRKWRGTGVAVPVFSLRSANSLGTGEFSDIKPLADWAAKTGLKLIQLLPVNDTIATKTWQDSYPYKAISAFALHPLYLNIEAVARKEDAQITKTLAKKRTQLNEAAVLDYEEVVSYKWKIVKQLYQQQKKDFFAGEEYKAFFEENKKWLAPYAAYCYLRDKNGTADFNQWTQYATYQQTAIEKFFATATKLQETVGLYLFVQFHLHLQLKEAVDYANKKGLALKGDIPIGVSRNGCDAWVEPELFNMDMQAGAPPDDFATKGQNWGFPTYNWKRMEADGYEWWERRFAQMSVYFDAFRIDHVLGFFRIWSIPVHAVDGIMGRFVPAIPVHINEFAQRGISFEYNRFCQPYINDEILYEQAGAFTDVIKTFLNGFADGTYALKEGFTTQAAVAAHFQEVQQYENAEALQEILLRLIANVLVFEDELSNGQEFHFRIDVQNTSSFNHLDAHTKTVLYQLYVDYFYKRQDHLWAVQAMHTLPGLKKSTEMLICGEDLGMVPACVPDVMNRLGILSLEIQRMPKQPGLEFFNPANAPYLSVITPSTHDMSTIRGWWEEDREKTQRFFNNEMQHPGLAPYYCEAWIDKSIIIQHLYSPAMWSIFQLQDLMGIDLKIRRENPTDERINIPADAKHYWRYRMHLTLEDLLQQKDFNTELKSYIQSSGRL